MPSYSNILHLQLCFQRNFLKRKNVQKYHINEGYSLLHEDKFGKSREALYSLMSTTTIKLMRT